MLPGDRTMRQDRRQHERQARTAGRTGRAPWRQPSIVAAPRTVLLRRRSSFCIMSHSRIPVADPPRAKPHDGSVLSRTRSTGLESSPCPPSSSSPNILLIMTDQERYPPPYEDEAVAKFRKEQLGARESLRDGGLEFHRHYAGSTACTPSRATLFTGQYPSLHGVSQTDGTSKQNDDPAMMWLDPDSVPTLGDWFRAGGYQTHYRGKWHVSLADLLIPGTPRRPDGLRRRREADRGRGRGVSQGRSARPVRVLRVDRPRAARRDPGRVRRGARRSVRGAGGGAVRRARAGARRRTVARGVVVRESPRHRGVRRDGGSGLEVAAAR